MEYVEAQRANGTGDNRAIASYVKGGFVTKLSPELPRAIVDHMVGDPNRTTILFFQHCGGAAGRVAENATAFAQRDCVANMMAVTAWRAGDEPAAHIESTRKSWAALAPYTRGFYVNDLAREVTSAEINANFRGNYPRLVQVKVTILRDTEPFMQLIAANSNAMLPDELFDRWFEATRTILLNTVPVHYAPARGYGGAESRTSAGGF
jgi:hypothetical protein